MEKLTFVVAYLLFVRRDIFCAPGEFNFNGNIQHTQNLHVKVIFSDNSAHKVGTVKNDQNLTTNRSSVYLSTQLEENHPFQNQSQTNSPSNVTRLNVNSTEDLTKNDSGKQEDLQTEIDLQEDYIKFGIDINPELEEILDESDDINKLISSPGCPLSFQKAYYPSHPLNRDIWVQYGEEPKCYLVGTKGPCPDGMKLAAKRNSKFGVCKCGCYFDGSDYKYNSNGSLDPFFENSKPFCYANGYHFAFYKDRCYPLLTKGPCNESDVFLFDNNTQSVTCKSRECPKRHIVPGIQLKYNFSFKVNNTCKSVGEPCQPHESVKAIVSNSVDGNFYDVWDEAPFPACVYYDISTSALYTISHNFEVDKRCNSDQLFYSVFLKKCSNKVGVTIGRSVG